MNFFKSLSLIFLIFILAFGINLNANACSIIPSQPFILETETENISKLKDIFDKQNIKYVTLSDRYSMSRLSLEVGIFDQKDGYSLVILTESITSQKTQLIQSFSELFGDRFTIIKYIVINFLYNEIGKPYLPKGYAGQNDLQLSTRDFPKLKYNGQSYCYQTKQYKIDGWFVSHYQVPTECYYDGGNGASCPRWLSPSPSEIFTSRFVYKYGFWVIIGSAFIGGILWYRKNLKLKKLVIKK